MAPVHEDAETWVVMDAERTAYLHKLCEVGGPYGLWTNKIEEAAFYDAQTAREVASKCGGVHLLEERPDAKKKPEKFYVWDGIDKFWKEESSAAEAESRWIEGTDGASIFGDYDTADEYGRNVGGFAIAVSKVAERVGGYVIGENDPMPPAPAAPLDPQAAKKAERDRIISPWDEAAKNAIAAEVHLEKAKRLNESSKREYQASVNALGHYLALLSTEKTGKPMPNGAERNSFSAYFFYTGCMFHIRSVGWHVNEDKMTTSGVEYRVERVELSVFDFEQGVHHYPKSEPKG